MQSITPENIKEELKSFFIKFPPLQNNYCEKCLSLMGSQFDTDVIDTNMMDTGVCDKCGTINEVINPFIYAVSKLSDIAIYGKSPRVFREDGFDILYKQHQVKEKLTTEKICSTMLKKERIAKHLKIQFALIFGGLFVIGLLLFVFKL